MSLFEKLFGKWEVVSKREATASVGGILGSYETEVVVILERNNKSNKERAYVKFMDGKRRYIDVDFAKQIQ